MDIADAKKNMQKYLQKSENAHHLFVGGTEELTDYDGLEGEDEAK